MLQVCTCCLQECVEKVTTARGSLGKTRHATSMEQNPEEAAGGKGKATKSSPHETQSYLKGIQSPSDHGKTIGYRPPKRKGKSKQSEKKGRPPTLMIANTLAITGLQNVCAPQIDQHYTFTYSHPIFCQGGLQTYVCLAERGPNGVPKPIIFSPNMLAPAHQSYAKPYEDPAACKGNYRTTDDQAGTMFTVQYCAYNHPQVQNKSQYGIWCIIQHCPRAHPRGRLPFVPA